MYKRTNKEFLLDMMVACKRMIRYTENMNFENFSKDEKTIDAVIRNVEILGEAVKNISLEFKEKYPEVKWSMIARTRDKLIHFYFGLDIEVLWKILKDDIPELRQKLEYIMQKEGWQNEI
ncbi:HepT-like ribonuclease domain-containing protein [Pseudothermotoga lettingae]|uniref:HepT-like ribonuclease domain-containing protein n=1 Tax=Pseudothermotoga lettingae TaxID=177758 RepID=UPI00074AC07A|nr:DUF86 domain-containing protein [Pseudothermotoga lettingae]KUK20194.1 MAG: Uncharacterized protein XD56_1892 [Pseudothermotoga lettingae]HBT26914.1 nucleotidyltransferase [Pseudothermotoga sp.]